MQAWEGSGGVWNGGLSSFSGEVRRILQVAAEHGTELWTLYFVWWPQVDDGLLLENFVRDHPEMVGVAAATEDRRGVAA